MSVAWSTVQKALQDWVVLGTGLADTSVLWAGERVGRPAYPYAILTLSASAPAGFHERRDYDAVEDELAVTRGVQRPVTLTVEVFTDSVSFSGGALNYLDQLLGTQFTQTQRDAFYAAGVAYQGVDNIVQIPDAEGRPISRWATDVRFLVASTSSTTESDFIESVEITSTTTDGVNSDETTETLEL